MATAILVRHLAIPYTVALVLIGLLLGTLGVHSSIRLSRGLIIDGFLPLLLFEGALRVDLKVLRRALLGIIVLAGPGIIVSALIVAAVLQRVSSLSLAEAALFGAFISATDPVAVLAIFRRLQLPKPLTMLIEGESVLNDGTAIVLFGILLPAAQGQSLSLLPAAGQFFAVVLGGVAVGVACGWVMVWLEGLTDDHLIELALTVLLAYGSFLIAQELQVSGVIACAVAGLTFAARSGSHLSDGARERLQDMWEFGAFLVNSLLFVLIGLLVSVVDLARNFELIGWAILATLVARLIVVYGFGLLLQLGRLAIVPRFRFLVFWGGLRGAVPIAMALSLPASFPYDTLFLSLTVGVVLFTLLAQGLSLRPLIHLAFRQETP